MSAMETKHRSCTWLTTWMGVHAGNVSNGNQAQELHMTHTLDGSSSRECQQWKSSTGAAHDSQPRWEFMQGMSAMETKHRSCTWLTCWMGVHPGNVSIGNQAQELHMTHNLNGSSSRECQQWKSSTEAAHDSHPGWEFIQEMSALEIKHRSWTWLTPWMQEMLAMEIKLRCTWLTSWMWFNAGNIISENLEEQLHSTWLSR